MRWLYFPDAGGGGPTPLTVESGFTIVESSALTGSEAVAECAGTGGTLFGFYTHARGLASSGVPAGWTSIAVPEHTSGDPHLIVFWKAATAGDDGFTASTTSGTARFIAGMFRVLGAHATPISGTPASQNADTDDTPTCPTMTPAHDNCLIFRIFGQQFGNWATEDAGYPGSHTGLFTRTTSNESTAGHQAGGAAFQVQTTAAATGAASFSNGGTSRANVGVTFAVRPA